MFAFAVVLALAASVSALPKTAVPAYLNSPTIDLNGSWRVVGGSDAPAGAYPYMISLRAPANNHFCGGSIVNSRTILTAAHCLIRTSPSIVNAVAGTNTLNAGGVSIGAQTFIIYPQFDYRNLENDVAVVLLQSSLPLSSLIAPVALDTGDTGSVPATLIGWGVTGVNDPTPNNLQRLDTQTISNALCSTFFPVPSSQICALTQAGEGACMGDSGGPLVETATTEQVGIVSIGEPCALGYPDVYTRVGSFATWVNSVSIS